MSLYCAICLYPAPCGRDHGEDRDGNDYRPVIHEREPQVWIGGEPLDSSNVPTEWHCTHCNDAFLLMEAFVHIDGQHADCVWCSSERLIIAGILDWQARHPEAGSVA